MIEAKDKELLDELISNTKAGKIRWIPTAKPAEFTASFRGRFSVLISAGVGATEIDPSILGSGFIRTDIHILALLDENGRCLHTIDDPSVIELWTLAQQPKRFAEQAIDEIIQELRSR